MTYFYGFYGVIGVFFNGFWGVIGVLKYYCGYFCSSCIYPCIIALLAIYKCKIILQNAELVLKKLNLQNLPKFFISRPLLTLYFSTDATLPKALEYFTPKGVLCTSERRLICIIYLLQSFIHLSEKLVYYLRLDSIIDFGNLIHIAYNKETK